MPLILIDGPPGIGCPVIASLGGGDAALVVTEPSVSGIHDLERILGLCRHFQVPAWVCVNKADINPENTARFRAYCREEKAPVIGGIPYDPVVTEAMVARKTILEYDPGGIVAKEIRRIWTVSPISSAALTVP